MSINAFMNKMVLGVRVDSLSKAQILEKAGFFLSGNKSHKIYTPNPEMLVKAQRDHDFRKILNSSDINLCDGFGLSIFSGAPRFSGVDFMLELCQLAEKEGNSIYLLGSGSDFVVAKTVDKLQEKFPKINIVGFDKGPDIDEIKIVREEGSETLQNIINASPDILFVAFGMGKQEKWIDKNLHKIPSVKIAVGVGGSFDFVSGLIQRAPCSMRNIGLEWLYRLYKQPKRFLRIVNAVLIFSFLAIKEKIF